jgi:magnesium transporter
MTELPELTLAYLRQRPESAARALEGLTSEDAAGIMQRAPSRIAAPVLAAMTTLYAARCVAQLPPDVAAAHCDELAWSDSAGLLRTLDESARNSLLGEMPASKARRFRRSLDYADDTIGAWMELDAASLQADRCVADAARLLTGMTGYAESHLLLTDAAQRYTGAVPLGTLLSSIPGTALETLALKDLRPLRDTASLASALTAQDWERSTILPVVNHRGELLGGLTRRTLRRALQDVSEQHRDEPPSVFSHLLRAYLSSGEGLLRLLLQAPRRGSQAPGPGT